jgi:alpha-galactosidase
MKFVQHPNLKITFIIAIIIFLSEAIQAQDVIKTKSPEGWLLITNESVYQMVITGNKKVRQVYYGTLEQKDYLKDNALWTNSIDEVPVRGGLPFKMPVAEVIFADGVRDLDLIYDSDEIYQENGKYILKIIQKDSHYPIKVISHFKVYKEHDIIEKWITIENQDRENAVLIENLLSGSIVLPHNEYKLTYLSGTHMHEFQEQKMLLTPGLKTIESRAFKSNANAPWFMVSTNETDKHQ